MACMDRFQYTEAQKEYIRVTHQSPELTPAQMDDRLADEFKLESFNYGLQYFGAARFAMAAGFVPAGPSILHRGPPGSFRVFWRYRPKRARCLPHQR